jgi:hypothetical protein
MGHLNQSKLKVLFLQHLRCSSMHLCEEQYILGGRKSIETISILSVCLYYVHTQRLLRNMSGNND